MDGSIHALPPASGGGMVVTSHIELPSDQGWTLPKERLKLSRQQAEIVQGILNGRSDGPIARELDISVPAVRTYMARLCQKSHIRGHVELLAHVFASLRECGDKRDSLPRETTFTTQSKQYAR